MKSGILGIDLGTSSVKLVYSTESQTVKVRQAYDEISPEGWFNAICAAAKQIDLSGVRAIGFSSQVGTYIINGKSVISWADNAGSKELEQVLEMHTPKEYAELISMPHPKILSYPLVKLLYIKHNFSDLKSVCMPKDYLIERLTGNFVTDKYSYRGLANLQTGEYSKLLLDEIGVDISLLPKIIEPCAVAGAVTKAASEQTGIPEGTRVYTGCNDYYAGLLGMGMFENASVFDITGTSEHIGIITDKLSLETPLVNGPYFNLNTHYGVTASSGVSANFGRQFADYDFTADEILSLDAPIFLPYLNGERAPIYDANARGVFFGITPKTTNKAFAYSVLEGIVFSLYHIYELMGISEPSGITVAGGAAAENWLNILKASMFGARVTVLKERDTSALGAMMLAGIGCGDYVDMKQAIAENCEVLETVEPIICLKPFLQKRFEIYKMLYPPLKESFRAVANTERD